MMTDPRMREYIRERLHGGGPAAPQRTLSPAPVYGSPQGSWPYQLGSRSADFLSGTRALRPLGNFATGLGRDHVSSALLGGAAGAAFGLGSGLAQGSEHPLARTLAGAGLGATGTLLLSKLMEYRDGQEQALTGKPVPRFKYSFYGLPGGPNPVQFIQSSLFQDMTLAPGDKSMLMGLLPNLNMSQTQGLSEALRGTAGAGAGALIARYLFKLGMGGQALMALVGGAMGSAMGGSPRNAFGQRVNTHYDSMGRQRLVQ